MALLCAKHCAKTLSLLSTLIIIANMYIALLCAKYCAKCFIKISFNNNSKHSYSPTTCQALC